jgi:hypothetical protein
MIKAKDFIVIGVISLALSIVGFILDLNERVPDIKTNIFETLMMAGFIYGFISIVYFPVKLMTNKSKKQRS